MNYNKKPNIRDLRLEEKNIPVSSPIIPNLSLNDKLNIPSQPVIPNFSLNQTTNVVNQPIIEDVRDKILKEDYNKSYVNTSIKTLIPKTPEIIYAWYDARSNVERYIMPFGTINLAGEYQIFELTFNNSKREDSIYLNGYHRGTVEDMPLTNHNGGQLAIFRNRARNNFAQGSVAEVICIGNVIEETRQKIEGYLAWKWDLQTKLPLEHPYRFDGTLYNQFPYLLI